MGKFIILEQITNEGVLSKHEKPVESTYFHLFISSHYYQR